MNNLFLDSQLTDDSRRERLYQGDLFVFSPSPSSIALCTLAKQLAAEAFAPFDPPYAQFEMPVEEYVRILAELKPKFIHHPACKQLIPALLEELGGDARRTYFDVPRLRTVTAQGYLTSGLGYAFQPHRDTWYSPPMCQLNWWLP
ncbi:MAG TPA: hypothetical protein VMM76_08020, partial [Pirellulaceae bacterium]|nr:hypothetical protein [Pirellulaceae bacterium]